MFVNMDLASQAKRGAPRGRESGVMSFLISNESLKYDGWEEALGWSIWSTHLPSPCRRLLTSEHTV